MKSVNLWRCAVICFVMILATASVSFGAKELSESEIAEIIQKVEQGDAEAQFRLGAMYHDGLGVKQDYEQALYWLNKSAEQGNAKGQFGLASLYVEGKGVTKDYKQAFYWMKKAAEQGLGEAQYTVALSYLNGDGVTEDYQQAFQWVKKAAEQGLGEAQRMLGMMFTGGIGTEKDDEQADYWYTQAAKYGNTKAKEDTGEATESMQQTQAAKVTPQSKPQPQPSESESVIEVGIKQLLQDYKDNKIAARRKYDGKRIRLSGFVNNIDEEDDDDKEIYITLDETKDPFSPGLRCYFSESEADSVMRLKEGQSAIIEGKCRSGENMLGVTIAQLVNSRIVSVSQSSSQPTPQPATSAKNTPAKAAKPEPENTLLSNDPEKNVQIFKDSLLALAQNIAQSSPPKFQDIDWGIWENETYFMQAWSSDDFLLIGDYNNDWSKGYITDFYISSHEAIFAGGINVGTTTLSELQRIFSNYGMQTEEYKYSGEFFDIVGDGYGIHFSLRADIEKDDLVVQSIEYTAESDITRKMSLLSGAYNGKLRCFLVTGNKVNVRSAPNTKGKVIFQVSNSQDDRLIIDISQGGVDESDGWVPVAFRIRGDDAIELVGQKAYISSRFIEMQGYGYLGEEVRDAISNLLQW